MKNKFKIKIIIYYSKSLLIPFLYQKVDNEFGTKGADPKFVFPSTYGKFMSQNIVFEFKVPIILV